MPVISWIEFIGGGQVGGGSGGWEAEGRLKQPFGVKQQCCAFSMGPELVQSTGRVDNKFLRQAEQVLLYSGKF